MELNNLVAVILAGGLGTRVRHLLPDIPKPMAPVAGKPFLEWVVRYLANEGIRRVIISTGYRGETVAAHFQTAALAGVSITCVDEPEPLGTAGGFLHAVSKVPDRPESWLVVNGDSLVLCALAEVASSLADAAVAGVIVAVKVPDAGRYGTLSLSPAGDLLRFEENRPGSGIINAGLYLFRDSLVGQFPGRRPLSLEQDVLPNLAGRGVRLKAHITDAPFLDIGTPESLRRVLPFLQANPGRFLRS